MTTKSPENILNRRDFLKVMGLSLGTLGLPKTIKQIFKGVGNTIEAEKNNPTQQLLKTIKEIKDLINRKPAVIVDLSRGIYMKTLGTRNTLIAHEVKSRKPQDIVRTPRGAQYQEDAFDFFMAPFGSGEEKNEELAKRRTTYTIGYTFSITQEELDKYTTKPRDGIIISALNKGESRGLNRGEEKLINQFESSLTNSTRKEKNGETEKVVPQKPGHIGFRFFKGTPVPDGANWEDWVKKNSVVLISKDSIGPGEHSVFGVQDEEFVYLYVDGKLSVKSAKMTRHKKNEIGFTQVSVGGSLRDGSKKAFFEGTIGKVISFGHAMSDYQVGKLHDYLLNNPSSDKSADLY